MKTLWIWAIFGVICFVSQHVGGTSNSTKKRSSGEYYQINYADYEIFNNNSLDVEFSSDSLIIPIPDDATERDSAETSDKAEETVDGDLKEHDFIDNLMYIYYGSGNKVGRRPFASEIIIVGSVLSTVAQISTILLILVKKDIHTKKDLKELFLHLMFSFGVTNVAFILGIFETKYYVECLLVALLLTYFHMMSSVWIFIYCFHIFKVFCRKEPPKRKYYFICGYGLPMLFSLVSFLLAPQSYETRKYCFMSVQRGMIINYMVPVFCLMILTAVYCIKGIGIFNMELNTLQANSNLDSLTLYNTQMEVVMGKKCSNVDAVNLRASKSCLRRLCAMQTMYDIVWFFLVLALENVREGSSMAVVYAFTSCCLNWYIFAKLKVFFPNANKPKLKEVTSDGIPKQCNGVENIDLSPVTSESNKQGSSDSVPLLIESTELKILHHNPNISTISS
ncbi:uncharacterized protein LOC123313996 [Coccinella septempunctata]|uniref:uncharacterized protein LOC123313996 n=1 Tax=Coccinella septempunctata TaxID=41139 RepID=UPI001D08BEA6|nr:uncharacterized protein LOC123313996 [Coccinella septempunctata]